MKNLELTEKEVELVITALARHYTWEAANDLIVKITEQANRVVEESAKPKK